MTDHCAHPKCGKELTHIPGRRKKKYCDPTCKLRHWQELNPVKKPLKTKRIPLEEWEKIQKKVQDLSKPNTEVKPVEQPQTNYVIDTQKISELEKELAAIPDKTKGLGKLMAKSLQDRIYKLKHS